MKDESMLPNIQPDSWVWFKRIHVKQETDIKRGDIVAVEMTPTESHFGRSFSRFIIHFFTLGLWNYDPPQLIMRRVVGIYGDKISINNKSIYFSGELYIPEWNIQYDDVRVLPLKNSHRDNHSEIFVPKDSYYLLSDFWDQYGDSRNYGIIPKSQIKGKLIKIFK